MKRLAYFLAGALLACALLFAACENPILTALLPQAFTVTFDRNHADEGTSPDPARITLAITEQTAGKLPAPLTRPGYEFKEWNTRADGSGGTFTEFSIVESSLTVYAQWLPDEYTVTFYDDPDGEPYEVIQFRRLDFKLGERMPADPVHESKGFTGWNTKADGSGVIFTADTALTGNIDVYAQWNSYTVVFYLNYDDAEEPVHATRVIKYPALTVDDLPNLSDRELYSFGGWNTKADGTGETFTASTHVSEAMNVYAQWHVSKFNINFFRNDGSPGSDAYSYHTETVTRPDTKLGVLPVNPEQDGYEFLSWNTDPDRNGITFTDETFVDEDFNVYAQWKPISYTVSGYVVSLLSGTAISELSGQITVKLYKSDGKLEGTCDDVDQYGSYIFHDFFYDDYTLKVLLTEDGWDAGYMDILNVPLLAKEDLLPSVNEPVPNRIKKDLYLSKVVVYSEGKESKPFLNLWDAMKYIGDTDEAAAYTVSLGEDQFPAPCPGLSIPGSEVTIETPLREDGHPRNNIDVPLQSAGNLFKVGSLVTLRLKKGITFRGRSSNNSPLISMDVGSRLFMEDGVKILDNVNTSGPGGGVFVSRFGELTMDGGEISGHKAAGGGGGVYAEGSFVMKDGEIIDNEATGGNGGGVHITAHGTFTIDDGDIRGNRATGAGGHGGGVYAEGTLFMRGGEIWENTASNSSSNNAGGGVYVTANFTMTGGTIKENTAKTDGGGVYSTGDFTLDGGTITENKLTSARNAAPYGGGAGVFTGGNFAMKKGTVSTNSINIANSSGAGVYVNSGTFTLSGGEISGNTVSSSFDSYNSYSYGGGVYVSGGNFTMTDGTISGNTFFSTSNVDYVYYSRSYGGGVCVSGGTFTMNNGTISGNTSGNTSSSSALYSSYTYGGGVYVSGGTFTMNNGTISGNAISTYYTYGGGVYVSGGTFTMNNGTISGNTTGVYDSYGGGVYVDNGTFTMEDGIISSNTSNRGGGVSIYNLGTFIMKNGSISDNVNIVYGGGVYVGNGTFTMEDGIISSNTATNGGGVLMESNSVFYMKGGAIAMNVSTASVSDNIFSPYMGGGGVFVGNGNFIMTGGAIEENMAMGFGGGVRVVGDSSFGGDSSEARFTMESGRISGNRALSNGGGVSMGTYGSGTSTFIMRGRSDGVVTENIITGNLAYNGGGVYLLDGTFGMANGTISGNTSTNGGGGLYVDSRTSTGTFTMINGIIAGNSAATNGGGVFVNSGIFSKSGGIVYGKNAGDDSNIANAGCAVYVNDSDSNLVKKREITAGELVNLNSGEGSPNFGIWVNN